MIPMSEDIRSPKRHVLYEIPKLCVLLSSCCCVLENSGTWTTANGANSHRHKSRFDLHDRKVGAADSNWPEIRTIGAASQNACSTPLPEGPERLFRVRVFVSLTGFTVTRIIPVCCSYAGFLLRLVCSKEGTCSNETLNNMEESGRKRFFRPRGVLIYSCLFRATLFAG